MDTNNLKQALMAVAFLAAGVGAVAVNSFVSILLVGVFAQQVSTGTIPTTNATNTTIQSLATTFITANATIAGLVTLIAGLASLVIIVLALLGKVDFAKMGGVSKGGSKF